MIRVVCILIGYLFGLFQTAYLIGKMHGIDIRNYGSGNSGTTNMMRTLGTKAGLWTFAGDFLKCVAAVLVVRLLFGKRYPDMIPLLGMYTSAGVILGHNYPFYLNFRGGKGIAATAGMIFSLFNPILCITEIAIFAITFKLTHYVSLGSLLVYVGLVVQIALFSAIGWFHMSRAHLIEMFCVTVALAVLAFWKHRENIQRLRNGTERKTYLSKKNHR